MCNVEPPVARVQTRTGDMSPLPHQRAPPRNFLEPFKTFPRPIYPMTLPPGTTEHKTKAGQRPAIRCAVVTVSDSRTEATDESGDLIRSLLGGHGHAVTRSALLRNDEAATRTLVEALINDDSIDAVILTGGTGLSRRDRTIEAVMPLFTREIPGFGELFRHVSYSEQIGAAAMLSRATAGVAQGTLIVALPGSRAAVELALTRILLQELAHLVYEINR